MPAKASELRRAAARLGFERERQHGSHETWRHPDGRQVVIPIHGSRDISGWLFRAILSKLGITEDEFRQLR